MLSPNVEFYFAGDGHEHWHVRDFDATNLLDAQNQRPGRREARLLHAGQHRPMTSGRAQARPPSPGVYLEETSCGKGLPSARTIVHGLSKGWGDTYPTTLPDQAIDLTGVPERHGTPCRCTPTRPER